jgi:AcrR family transcriptional regulator
MSSPAPARRPTLSREQVVASALELLDAEGLQGFSMRKLAARLDVDPMTIYWHIKGRERILDAVAAAVLADVRVGGQGPWWRRVEHALREHRRVLKAHPAVLELLLTHPVRSAEAWAGGNEALELLERHVGAEAHTWLRSLVSYVNGFLLTERPALGRHTPTPVPEELADELPRVAATLRALGPSADMDFDHGLRVLMSGLRAAARS